MHKKLLRSPKKSIKVIATFVEQSLYYRVFNTSRCSQAYWLGSLPAAPKLKVASPKVLDLNFGTTNRWSLEEVLSVLATHCKHMTVTINCKKVKTAGCRFVLE